MVSNTINCCQILFNTKKFKKATTDSEGIIAFDKERAGVYNLLNIYQCFTKLSQDSIEAEFAGQGYGKLKERVAEVVIEGLRPIRESYENLIQEKEYLHKILLDGENKAREIATTTYASAKEKMGLV